MKNVIKRYNEIASDAYLSECKIMPMSDDRWWQKQMEYYGAEALYNIIKDGIDCGDFDWNDMYFQIFSESREIKSFNTLEDIVSWFGLENLKNMGIEL
jgi:hypothetical protein